MGFEDFLKGAGKIAGATLKGAGKLAGELIKEVAKEMKSTATDPVKREKFLTEMEIQRMNRTIKSIREEDDFNY